MLKKVLTFIIAISFEAAVVYCAANGLFSHFIKGLLK